MLALLLLVSTAATAILAAMYLKKMPIKLIFVHPFFFDLFFLIFLFIIRYWLTVIGAIPSDESHSLLFKSLQFAFVYFIVYYAISYFITFTKNRTHLLAGYIDHPVAVTYAHQAFITFLLVTAILALLYCIPRDLLHTLGKSKGRRVIFIDAAVLIIFETRHLLIAMLVVLFCSTRNRLYLYLLIATAPIYVLHALISGGRHYVLPIFLAFSIIATSVRPTLKAMAQYAVCAILIISFMMVITIVRESGEYRKAVNLNQAIGEFSAARQDLFEQYGDALFSLFDRITLYGRELPKVIRTVNEGTPKTEFTYGSIYDLLKFIPRIIWKGKPTKDFNYWMSEYLYNRSTKDNFNCPIGRTAEAYYIGGRFGFLVAIPYCIIYLYFFNTFYLQPNAHVKSILFKALYIYAHISYIEVGAGTYFDRLSAVMQFLILIFPILYLVRKAEIRHVNMITR